MRAGMVMLVAFLLLVFVGAAAPSHRAEAAAPELVHFESAPVQPTPLRLSLAEERGETLTAEPGTPIQGYLFRPQGAVHRFLRDVLGK